MKPTVFSIFFLWSLLFSADINISGKPTSVFYDGEKIFVGKEDGLFSVDIDNYSEILINNSGIVKDVRACGDSVCALFATASGSLFQSIDDSFSESFESFFNEFSFAGDNIYFLSKYSGLQQFLDNRMINLSSKEPLWKNNPKAKLKELFIADGTSFDSDGSFTFIYAAKASELFMIVDDSYELVASCNSLLCSLENKFIPLKNTHYPLYFLPLFFSDLSKISAIANLAAFYFSYENLLLRVDFSGFVVLKELPDTIIDFSIKDSLGIFLLNDKIVIADLSEA